jgi:hypothetical protein
MKIVMAAAQADDGPHAVAPEEFCAQFKSRLHADAIEDQASATWPGDLLDLLGGVENVTVVDNVVRAERIRLFQFFLVHIRRHDADRREHAQQLNGHMSESADTEDDNMHLDAAVLV